MSLRWTEEQVQDYLSRQPKIKAAQEVAKNGLQALIEERGFIPAERVEQSVVARYLDMLGVRWCHVPNEGKRKKSTGGFLVGQGMKAGCPDILIFTPPPLHPEARGVAIEMKRIKGGRVSDEQREWLDDLASLGWIAQVCHGANAAIRFLKQLGWV